jgi:small-conductance mechanosensitive channel
MATNPTVSNSAAAPRRVMSRMRLIVLAALLASLAACLIFAWSTRDAMAHLPFLKGQSKQRASGAGQKTLVDLRPWQTAQALAALAVTAEEAEYARDAERLADHEVDQAFASALRQASMQPRALTGEALKLSQKLKHLQQVVKEDQLRVEHLTQSANRSASSASSGAAHVILADDLDIAKAQLGLDSDEVADAQQDLARAVGDERNQIQQELTAHEANMRKYDAQTAKEIQVATVSAKQFGTLARRLKEWIDQRIRYGLIQEAMQRAQADAAALIQQHDQLENAANAPSSPEGDKTAEIASLNSRAARRQLLSIYDDRIQTQQQLASVYGKWSAQVLLQHRIVLHLLLESLALIAFILLCLVLLDALVRQLVERPKLDRRNMHALGIIFRLALRVVGIVFILIVIFGLPSQMPTIIGLTTAGMTVVLQDFILAFLGWFVLMGKNGIRVGDWVEINGIGGEVVETGVFRTVLLETGNWTDKGHPTGRRVTFMNGFAVKGQFFNFSTTGQWMWDEITVTIPPREDTYRIVELIHKAVLSTTENDARLAEQEWMRVTKQNRLGRFTTASAVDMRPGIYGLDIIVRYITRASERFEMRNRLYQCVIDLLHESAKPAPPVEQLRPAFGNAGPE